MKRHTKLITCILFVFLFSNSFIMAQIVSPEQVVQENVDFYNKRDIEGFMRSFRDDITVLNFSDFKITLNGAAEVRNFYEALFRNSPQLHSTIAKRIVLGNKVIDYERIKGRNGSPDLTELVLIYEVEGEKIYKITVIRK